MTSIEERIQELHDKMDLIISGIKNDFQSQISKNLNPDIVTNEQYCTLRTAKGFPLSRTGLFMWFKRYPDCPRVDRKHVSVTKLDKWAEEQFKPKTKEA